MEIKVPQHYTGTIKRRLTIKKLEKYYFIIDYYENGKLVKSTKNYYTKKPLEQEFIKTHNIQRPELCSHMEWSKEPDEVIYEYK